VPEYIKNNNIDIVIANGENSSDGVGINSKIFKNLLEAGINVITMGNHTWGKKDIFNIIDDERLIRPANYSKDVPGKGYGIYELNGKNIAVINLIRKSRYECFK
jgi:calcineurin-like phosphoesterase